MRIRFLLAALAVALSACASPGGGVGAGQPSAAPATTTATSRQSARRPPGLTPAARRQPAPSMRVTAIDGRTISLDGFQGRPVVVNFFESWCGICQAEQPDLTKVAAEFTGRAGFVGISYHDTVAAGRAYQRHFGISYPLANDRSGETWARWRVSYQPVTVLVDGRGRVAQRFDGGTTGGTIRAALAYLVNE